MGKKIESNLKNMILSLALISLAASAALGMVYNLTKGPIEQANKAKEVSAITEVLPAFDNDPTASAKEAEGLTLYKGAQAEQPVGVAIKTFTDKGFSGYFSLMVGFLPDGTIHNISVLDQKETPGLGSKMKEDKFKNQFLGKNPETYKLLVTKDGGDVDAITAATISSRAYCDAVQKAYDLWKAQLTEGSSDSEPADSLKGVNQ